MKKLKKVQNNSKKLLHFEFAVHFVVTVLVLAVTDFFDYQIQILIHNINIFSELPNVLIKFCYLLLIFCALEKIYPKVFNYFSNKIC